MSNLFAGGAAGALSLAIVHPFDFARIRLVQDTVGGKSREFTGKIDCIRKTAATVGWSGKGGVYHGFGVTCAGAALYRSLYFGLYECQSSTRCAMPGC